jgi:hypothetical protein
MHAALDAHARGADAARVGNRLTAGISDLAKIEAVQGLSNGERRLSFRGAGGPGKEQARRSVPPAMDRASSSTRRLWPVMSRSGTVPASYHSMPLTKP